MHVASFYDATNVKATRDYAKWYGITIDGRSSSNCRGKFAFSQYGGSFCSNSWPAPTYAVRLAQDAAIIDCRATGHAYYRNGPEGDYAGETLKLETTRAEWESPPFAPAIIISLGLVSCNAFKNS